jgi:aspartyl protease family protein
MNRFALFMIGLSVFVALAMPSRHSSPVEVNQQILIDTTDTGISSGTTISPSYGGVTELARGANGSFYTDASVNGQQMPFVIDTGATMVALTVDGARRAGLYVDTSSFTVVGEGASGPTRGKLVTLDRIEVAGRTVEHVDAVVLEGLGTNLLGQSVLTRLGGIEMNGDKMVLR